jgi:phage gp45-like
MHRQTGAASAFRGYDSGGARALIDKIDDSPLMQTMTGTGMKGEAFSASKSGKFKGPEAPQNYGFTSIVADATKGANGMIQKCAEGFMSFVGGNRSFPVAAIMDDRRHRLKNLGKDAAKGASAMFGLKEWGQQLLNTEDGWYMTGNTEKKVRFQLVGNQNGKTQQQTPAQAQAHARAGGGLLKPIIRKSKSGVEFEVEVIPYAGEVTPLAGSGGSGGGGNGSGGGGGQSGQQASQSTGQKTLHKEESKQFFDMTTASLHQGNSDHHHEVKSDRAVGYHKSNDHSYRADSSHAHIHFDGGHIWVDGSCYASKPIIIKPDPCS